MEVALIHRLALNLDAMAVETCLRFLSMADITHAGSFAIGICVRSAFFVTTSTSSRSSLETLTRIWDLGHQLDVTDAETLLILTNHSLGALSVPTMSAVTAYLRSTVNSRSR